MRNGTRFDCRPHASGRAVDMCRRLRIGRIYVYIQMPGQFTLQKGIAMKSIQTERLLLRPWKADDAAEAASLFRYASEPEIGLNCGWPPHTSVEGSMNDIRSILAVEKTGPSRSSTVTHPNNKRCH